MPKNSRAKGQRGELECAALFREYGIEARRGQQYAGGGDSPDVVHGLPGVHVEVKRTERLSLYPALAQATKDAERTGKGEMPVVFHKANRKDWVCILSAEDLFRLLGRVKVQA